MYIPPDGTRYSDLDMFESLEHELALLNQDNQYHVCMMGDMNGYTGTLNDFASEDIDDNFDRNDVDMDLELQNIIRKEVELKKLGIPSVRFNQDVHEPNRYGRRLVELCRTHALYFMNGRIGSDRAVGAWTTRNKSVIDYVIGSASLLTLANDMRILTFDPMFSDVHCAISLCLRWCLTRGPL